MDKFYVIAGTIEQAKHWIAAQDQIRKYVIVVAPETLIGVSDPHGMFVGTWKQREDLNEMLTMLHLNSFGKNLMVRELMKLYGK